MILQNSRDRIGAFPTDSRKAGKGQLTDGDGMAHSLTGFILGLCNATMEDTVEVRRPAP